MKDTYRSEGLFLGYLWDKSDEPEAFLSSCSEHERKVFFEKYVGTLRLGIKRNEILKMVNIGVAFKRFGFVA